MSTAFDFTPLLPAGLPPPQQQPAQPIPGPIAPR